jgi:hypothetical protein
MSAFQEIPSSGTDVRRRSEPLGPPLAIAALTALAVLGVAGIGWLATNRSFGYFTRDPAEITHQASYMGLVSVFGLFAWAVGATALVCAGYLASLRGALERRNALYLTAAAAVYLLLDDAFRFHEYVYPHYVHVQEDVPQLVYAVVAVAAVAKARSFFASTNFGLLVISGVFFAISMGLDIAIHGERLDVLEDGAKLIGVFVLAVYCLDTALAESRRTLREPIRE